MIRWPQKRDVLVALFIGLTAPSVMLSCGEDPRPTDDVIRLKDRLCRAQSRAEIKSTHQDYLALQNDLKRSNYEAKQYELSELHIAHQKYTECMRDHLRLYGLKAPEDL